MSDKYGRARTGTGHPGESNTDRVLSALVRALPGRFFEFGEDGATRTLRGSARSNESRKPVTLSEALSPTVAETALEEARKAKEGDCLRVFTFVQDDRTFEARVAPVGGGWSVMIVTDATAAIELGKQFDGKRRHEFVANLAGGVAHDFNNMLSIVTGYAHLIAGDPTASDSVRDDVDVIVEATGRATELTAQLLAFSRPQPPNMEIVDVNRSVSGIERMVRALIPGSIALSLRQASVPCHVRVDRSKLVRIVMNLVVNARDAMPWGGALVIESRVLSLTSPGLQGKFVRLTVTDTGAGMDAETAARAFEPFFTTKGASGTGIGLSTVQRFSEQMGGFLELDTEPGRGTSVHLYLPIAADAGDRQTGRHRRVSTETETILVLSDPENPVRPWVIAQQRNANRRVIVSSTGEAVELVRGVALDIDVVVVPVPDRSGVARVIESLRERNPSLKVASRTGKDARSRVWFPRTEGRPRATPSQSVVLYEAVDQLLGSGTVADRSGLGSAADRSDLGSAESQE